MYITAKVFVKLKNTNQVGMKTTLHIIKILSSNLYIRSGEILIYTQTPVLWKT